MDIADLVIHVCQSVDTAEQHALEEQLRQVAGVIAPRFNSSKPHLLLVAYNPDSLESGTLLNTVRVAGQGVRAAQERCAGRGDL